MPGYIVVKNFEQFQHYKDRNPVWIKLYNSLLDDYAFACLQDASKMHLIGIWLLASKCDNRVPIDLEWIGKRIGAKTPVDLNPLVEAGFITLERRSQDASTSQADRLPREEKRREEKNPPPAAAKPARLTTFERHALGVTEDEDRRNTETRAMLDTVAGMLTSDEHRDALTCITRGSRDPYAWLCEVKAVIEGMHALSPHPTPAQVGTALWDMRVNGKPPEVAVFHGYCRNAAKPARASRPGNGGHAAQTPTAPVLIRKVI